MFQDWGHSYAASRVQKCAVYLPLNIEHIQKHTETLGDVSGCFLGLFGFTPEWDYHTHTCSTDQQKGRGQGWTLVTSNAIDEDGSDIQSWSSWTEWRYHDLRLAFYHFSNYHPSSLLVPTVAIPQSPSSGPVNLSKASLFYELELPNECPPPPTLFCPTSVFMIRWNK